MSAVMDPAVDAVSAEVAEDDRLQLMPEWELLDEGLAPINLWREKLGLAPLDSWPDEAISGDWRVCLIGCSLGGNANAAVLATEGDPVLKEIEQRFEDGDLEAVTTLIVDQSDIA
jgi:hypothetical protein